MVGTQFFPAAYFMVRFEANGTVDTGFGTNGSSSFDPGVPSVGDCFPILAADGSYYLLGISNNIAAPPTPLYNAILMHVNADGSLDGSFGGDGFVEIYIGPVGSSIPVGISLLDDGAIRVFVHFDGDPLAIHIRQFLPNGEEDPQFSPASVVLPVDIGSIDTIVPRKYFPLPNGAVYLAGFTKSGPQGDIQRLFFVRLNEAGEADHSFNGTGWYIDPVLNDVAWLEWLPMQRDTSGRFLMRTVAPDWLTFSVARYLPDGGLDTSYGIDGQALTGENVSQHAVDAEGKLFTLYGPEVKAYSAEGSGISQFGADGMFQLPENMPVMHLREDGSILFAKTSYTVMGYLLKVRRLLMEEPMGIPAGVPLSSILIHPNPAVEGRLTVEGLMVGSHVQVDVMDAQGRVVPFKLDVNGDKAELSNMRTSGSYLLRVASDERVRYGRFMVP